MKGILIYFLALAQSGAVKFGERSNARGHRVQLSSVAKSSRRWAVFPDQKDMHARAARRLGAEDRKGAESDVLRLDESFWEVNADLLGLADDAELVLVKSWVAAGGAVTHHKYSQVKHGVRVHGGEFVATVGAHGGVLRVNGLSISAPASSLDVAWVRSSKASLAALLSSIAWYVESALGVVPQSDINLATPLELVWFNPLFADGQEGQLHLAYYVNGRVEETSSGDPFVFDAFVSALTGDVLDVLDRSTMAQPSPFSYPLQNADINLYDAVWGSRWKYYELVFDTADTPYTYPKKNDDVFNTVIDNTLYTKNLFFSLSNGEMESWNGVDTTLNIAVNLTIPNAYFDGYGIQFGEAYTTDDVVVHEWVHGYTSTLTGLVYRSEPGALNEAFSDIFGEAVDILNRDTTDTDTLRTVWPTECRWSLEDEWGQKAGSDGGARWALGENITIGENSYGDNSIRDMYSPECFWLPSTTLSPYYHCMPRSYDNGGVHLNSAVPSRFFAVLVDGGQYEDPKGGGNIEVIGIGFTKALNLMYRTLETLTSTSQFLDFAVATREVCDNNVGQPLYLPNLLDYNITASSEILSASDCEEVRNALRGSGLDYEDDLCENLNCNAGAYCFWTECSAGSTVLAHEESFNEFKIYWSTLPMVCGEGQTSSIVRVFDQVDNLSISCIEFAYRVLGPQELTLSLYIDETGGNPDIDSLTLVENVTVLSINSYLYPQLQTISFEVPVSVSFPNKNATLVVALSMPLGIGAFEAGAQKNPEVTNTYKGTFFGGSCIDDFDHAGTEFMSYSEIDEDQHWYVKLTGTSDAASNDDNSGNDDINENDDTTDGGNEDTAACFAGDSQVKMADGSDKRIRDIVVGDLVQVIGANGEHVYADVIFLPHLMNEEESTFVTIHTASGRALRMTPGHLLPAGLCEDGVELSLTQSSDILVGTCVNTVDGRNEVVSVVTSKGEGIYSFVTSDKHGHVFVNGVEASSFSLHHAIPNSFYFAHRLYYALLQTIGMSRENIHQLMTSRVSVSVNRFVGDIAVAIGLYFDLV